jgi:purine nucleosidase
MRVLFDHDGGVDDFVALAFLAASPEVELVGVCVTPGDTELEPAVATTRALLDLAGLSHVAVAAGSIAGPHPFPDHFRVNGATVGDRTVLAGLDRTSIMAPLADEPAHTFAADLLLSPDEPVVVVATGPLSTLAAAMDEHPDVEDHIERLYWMGGAIDTGGNVELPGHDGSAEWNAHCDPAAAARVWDSNVDIRLCPLDATNAVPLTQELVHRLAACGGSPLAGFAAEAYGGLDRSVYQLWDVLTAMWLVRPDLLFSEVVPCEIVTEPPAEGQIRRVMAGRAVTAALDADGPGANDLLVERLCAWRAPAG